MPDLPRGTVTFLFTDIEGSTALWERDRAARWRRRSRASWPSCIAASQPTTASSTRPSAMRIQAAFPTAARRGAPRRSPPSGRSWPKPGPIARDRCGCAWRCMPGKPTPDARGDYLAAPLNRLCAAPGDRPWRPDPPDRRRCSN